MDQKNNRTSMVRARVNKHKAGLDKPTKILLIGFACVGLLLAFFAGKFIFDLVKGWSMTSLPGAPVTSVDNNTGSTEAESNTSIIDNTVKGEEWDGKSRVNILLLGLDYSERRQNGPEDQGNPLSDTMILVTIDPLSRTIGVMSLRRDLWVNIPGFDYNKINEAYKLGEDYKDSLCLQDSEMCGGGPTLAMKTVEEFLGVPIHFYAKVEFKAFTTLIDELGGIKVTLTQAMKLDWKGNGNVFTIEPGTYVMPGSYVLAYARTRDQAYGEGDIARGNRQMEVIMAVRDKVIQYLPQLIAKAPTLYEEISAGVSTNMTISQAIKLATLMAGIPRENMKTYNFTYNEADPQTNAIGAYILRPIMENVRTMRDEMFAEGSVAAAPIAVGVSDPAENAETEAGKIEILNGTAYGGLAEETGNYLTSQGLAVVSTGNSDQNYDYTTIMVHNSKPYTLSQLVNIMQVPNSRIFIQNDSENAADITVYLGQDWASNNQMP